MKTIYKIMIFLTVFEMTVILVNSMGIFPSESAFFSDVSNEDISAAGNNPFEIYAALFKPSEFSVGPILFDSADITAIILVIVTLGSGLAIFTKSFLPAIFVLQAAIILPMIASSSGFFRNLFEHFDSDALVYLAVMIVVGFAVIIFITIVETPTHGRS